MTHVWSRYNGIEFTTLSSPKIELVYNKSKRVFYLNIDQFMAYCGYSMGTSQKVNSICRNIGEKLGLKKFIEINKNQRFILVSKIGLLFTAKNGANIKKDMKDKTSSFLTLFMRAVKNKVVKDVEDDLSIKSVLTVGKFQYHYRTINEKVALQLSDVLRACGYNKLQTNQFDSFAFKENSKFGDTKYVYLTDVPKMKKTIRCEKRKKKVDSVFQQFMDVVYPCSKDKINIHLKESILTYKDSVFEFYKDEYNGVMLKTTDLKRYCGYMDENIKGSIKDLSVLLDEQGAYYMPIKNIEDWISSIQNNEFKSRLKALNLKLSKFK